MFFTINLHLFQRELLLRPIGGLAQLARALAWQARGQRFDSAILHLGN